MENKKGTIERRTYTAEEVAVILGISKRKAYYLLENTKDFKVFHVGERSVRVHKASFDQWFNNQNGEPDRKVD